MLGALISNERARGAGAAAELLMSGASVLQLKAQAGLGVAQVFPLQAPTCTPAREDALHAYTLRCNVGDAALADAASSLGEKLGLQMPFVMQLLQGVHHLRGVFVRPPAHPQRCQLTVSRSVFA